MTTYSKLHQNATELPYFDTLQFPCSIYFPQVFEACKDWKILRPDYNGRIKEFMARFQTSLEKFAKENGIALATELKSNDENLMFGKGSLVTSANPEVILRCSDRHRDVIHEKIGTMLQTDFNLSPEAKDLLGDDFDFLFIISPQLQEKIQPPSPPDFRGRCP